MAGKMASVSKGSRALPNKRSGRQASKPAGSADRFEPVKIETLFVVLDAIAWLQSPNNSSIAQFADVDPRTSGKVVKNALKIGLIDQVGSSYALVLPYPYKGTKEQKESIVREALVRLPLLTGVRQFLKLGDNHEVALRKAATIAGIIPYNYSDIKPLVDWAQSLNALQPEIMPEDFIVEAETKKENRHISDNKRRVAFLSHSSKDKPFIRQLAADLTANNIEVWLDEQRIRVGESIPEQIAQGLAASDYFLIAMSSHSAESGWVKKELNNALVNEVQRRKVHILPLKIEDVEMPATIADKKYADFSESYKSGLEELLRVMRAEI